MNYLIPFGMGLATFLMWFLQGSTFYSSILVGIAGVVGGYIGMFVFRKLRK